MGITEIDLNCNCLDLYQLLYTFGLLYFLNCSLWLTNHSQQPVRTANIHSFVYWMWWLNKWDQRDWVVSDIKQVQVFEIYLFISEDMIQTTLC